MSTTVRWNNGQTDATKFWGKLRLNRTILIAPWVTSNDLQWPKVIPSDIKWPPITHAIKHLETDLENLTMQSHPESDDINLVIDDEMSEDEAIHVD